MTIFRVDPGPGGRFVRNFWLDPAGGMLARKCQREPDQNEDGSASYGRKRYQPDSTAFLLLRAAPIGER